VRLKKLNVAGFRGFNSPRTIDFHHDLTVISAPNSHGKTSITEALEFLFYGQTSKVESADSKDEYKGSYENRHYPVGQPIFVEVLCVDEGSNDVLLRAELDRSGIRRFVNGQRVEDWPFTSALSTSARPFVVQHALKSLLLSEPSRRFQGFARILGLQDIDAIQQVLVNLCTKPEVQIPSAARQLIAELDVFNARLRSVKETMPVAKSLALGPKGVDDAFIKLHARGVRLLGKNVPPAELSSALVVLRNAAANKVYAGSVALKVLSTGDYQRSSAARDRIERAIGTFVDEYSRLVVGDTTDRLRKEAQMLGVGIELLADAPGNCPFCEQPIDASIRSHVEERHTGLLTSIGAAPDKGRARADFSATLKELASSVSSYTALQIGRSAELIAANTPEASDKIKALIGKGNEHSLLLIAAAGAAIRGSQQAVTDSTAKVVNAIEVCADAIRTRSEELGQAEALVKVLMEYVRSIDMYIARLEEVNPSLAEPSRLLQQAVDAQAGTTELSLLIEVLSKRDAITRAVKINDALESLKELKKQVDQAVGQTMEEAFSKDLTGAVMGWYERIRTTSDPDVHFSGFAMERTKAGDFKNRRVKVSAHSYGVELVSAVSSLSESKLNALGLCMSIATALRAPGPWDFLVLDDPIQSWDDDHEIQFIRIIRALAEDEKKQIVLMSHRDGWVDQVVDGCRSLNGLRYHIARYAKDGPVIQATDWSSTDQRLSEALAISNDPRTTPVRLQQAEEEIRIAACQLIAEVARKRLRRTTGAHSLNSVKARSILNEAGCPAPLLDRVISTFATTDPAHHSPKDYVPNAERVRQYHGALTDLKNWMATQN
jgi:hypothetical protein